jgi:hypothetical protein
VFVAGGAAARFAIIVFSNIRFSGGTDCILHVGRNRLQITLSTRYFDKIKRIYVTAVRFSARVAFMRSRLWALGEIKNGDQKENPPLNGQHRYCESPAERATTYDERDCCGNFDCSTQYQIVFALRTLFTQMVRRAFIGETSFTS